MSRVWSEGWEIQDMIGYCFGSDFGIPVVGLNSIIKRSGVYSLKVGTDSNTNGWLYKDITDVSEFYLRFAFYLDPHIYGATVPKIYWRGGSLTSYITFGSCYNIVVVIDGVTVDTGITTLYPDTWYLLEAHIKIDSSTGIVQIKLDGKAELEIDYTGDTGTGSITSIKFGMDTGYLGELSYAYFDDIALNDTAGGIDDAWPGEGKIIVMKPGGDSTPLELTPSAAVDHYTLVDDFPTDGDTTYVEGSVDDEEDMYTLVASGLVDVDINRVWTEARTRKTTANDSEVALITKASGGAEVSGGDVELLTTYTVKVLGAEELVNPVDSNPWEIADIDLIEIGTRTR